MKYGAKTIIAGIEVGFMGGIGANSPEDLVQCPPWMGHQQHVSKHVLLLSLQTHHIHAHVQMYESQHSNIVPAEMHIIMINKIDLNFLRTHQCVETISWTNLIKKQSKVGKLNSLIYISILTYDKWGFPSKFQSNWLKIAFCGQLEDNFSCACWSSESKLHRNYYDSSRHKLSGD